jgi:hypothetical protein
MIKIHLRDLGEPLIAAWRREFDGIDGVTVSLGDIFSDKPGAIGPDDPIDIRADAVVSPANSFGFMDGGIDALFTYQSARPARDSLDPVPGPGNVGGAHAGAPLRASDAHRLEPRARAGPRRDTDLA